MLLLISFVTFKFVASTHDLFLYKSAWMYIFYRTVLQEIKYFIPKDEACTFQEL
jgi:hypothetical protein